MFKLIGVVIISLAITIVKPSGMVFAGEERPAATEKEEINDRTESQTVELQLQGQSQGDDQSVLEQLLAQAKRIVPVILNKTGYDPAGSKEHGSGQNAGYLFCCLPPPG